LSSRACINHEPEITHTGTSDEESDKCEAGEEEGDKGNEGEGENEENAIVPLHFGLPKRHSLTRLQLKVGLCILLLFYFIYYSF